MKWEYGGMGINRVYLYAPFSGVALERRHVIGLILIQSLQIKVSVTNSTELEIKQTMLLQLQVR
jgi:hypothetical protein